MTPRGQQAAIAVARLIDEHEANDEVAQRAREALLELARRTGRDRHRIRRCRA